jgi:hypothetical protein
MLGWNVSRLIEFGVILGLGKASRMLDHAVWAAAPALGVAVLFFGSVNQVLVRLWARVTRVSVFGSVSGSRCSADLSDRACCLDRGA